MYVSNLVKFLIDAIGIWHWQLKGNDSLRIGLLHTLVVLLYFDILKSANVNPRLCFSVPVHASAWPAHAALSQ